MLKVHISRWVAGMSRGNLPLCGTPSLKAPCLEWGSHMNADASFDLINRATCFQCRTTAGIAKCVTRILVPEGQVGSLEGFPKRKRFAYAARPDMDTEDSFSPLDRYETDGDFWKIPYAPETPCVLCGHSSWGLKVLDPFDVPMFDVPSKDAWIRRVIEGSNGRFLLILEQALASGGLRLGAVRCSFFNPANYLIVRAPLGATTPKSRFARLLETDSV